MKILIADDHALFRDNLAEYITENRKDAVVMQVSSFAQALKLLQKDGAIDMIILDIDMLEPHIEQGIAKLHEISETLQIVVVSSLEDIGQIKKILSAGILGYIPRQPDLMVLKEAFDTVLTGQMYIPKALQDINESTNKIKTKALTARQSEVLGLIAQGKSNKQIAYEMNVSEATVKLHINALLRSLKVTNRTQAVIRAQQIGLI